VFEPSDEASRANNATQMFALSAYLKTYARRIRACQINGLGRAEIRCISPLLCISAELAAEWMRGNSNMENLKRPTYIDMLTWIFGCLLIPIAIPIFAQAQDIHNTTVWYVDANGFKGELVIKAPGVFSTTCDPIEGKIFGNPIEGKYCSSGQITFVRRVGSPDNDQTYTGGIANGAVSMTGTFTVGKNPKKFHFHATNRNPPPSFRP